MRKITQQAVAAFMACGNMSQANMTVTTTDDGTEMRLHGNLIARSFTVPGGFGVDDSRRVEIRDAGWQTTTTKERLNGLLFALGTGGCRLFQRDFEWYISTFKGDVVWSGSATFTLDGQLIEA